jgi:hypothetical protein
MKEKEIIKILQSVRGEVDAPAHRAHLRRAVLSQKEKGEGVFAALRPYTHIISMNRYYFSIGTVAAVAAIAVVVAMSPISSGVASAEEQVNRAFTRAVQISPEMRAQLEGNMKADMLETLKEAKAAPDLKIMTREEYEKDGQLTFSSANGNQSITVQGMAGAGMPMAGTLEAEEGAEDMMFTASATAIPAGKIGGATFSSGTMVINSDIKLATGTFSGTTAANSSWSAPVKYLSYTDPEGRKTVLGLDENDTPVFKLSTLNMGDAKEMGKDMIEMKAHAVQVIKVNTGGEAK